MFQHRKRQAGVVCRRRNAGKRYGTTLLEVILVISIVAFMLSLLSPMLRKAREQARRLICANNLRQWGNASQYYREDFNDFIPTEGTYLKINKPYTWFNVLPPYLNAPAYVDIERQGKLIKELPSLNSWICPSKNVSKYFKSRSGKNQFHYGMNRVLDGVDSRDAPTSSDQGELPIRANRYARKPTTVFMFDIFPNSPHGMADDVGTSYHFDYANVLFLDSGVGHFRASDFVTDGDYRNGSIIWNHPGLYWGYMPPTVAARSPATN